MSVRKCERHRKCSTESSYVQSWTTEIPKMSQLVMHPKSYTDGIQDMEKVNVINYTTYNGANAGGRRQSVRECRWIGESGRHT